MNSETIREDFLKTALSWEANFVKDIGVDKKTGMTYYGQNLDSKTGLPTGKPDTFTSPL